MGHRGVWAMRLLSGRICFFQSGLTTFWRRLRLNYTCARPDGSSARFLWGLPDESQATWRILQTAHSTGRHHDARRVAIATAWR